MVEYKLEKEAYYTSSIADGNNEEVTIKNHPEQHITAICVSATTNSQSWRWLLQLGVTSVLVNNHIGANGGQPNLVFLPQPQLCKDVRVRIYNGTGAAMQGLITIWLSKGIKGSYIR